MISDYNLLLHMTLISKVPEMDGLTCTRRIRALQENGHLTSHVPIIAVTANARSEQVTSAFDAGVDDMVTKPFRMHTLTVKMCSLLESIRLRSGSPENQDCAVLGAAGEKEHVPAEQIPYRESK